jgi:hypothetical protein
VKPVSGPSKICIFKSKVSDYDDAARGKSVVERWVKEKQK